MPRGEAFLTFWNSHLDTLQGEWLVTGLRFLPRIAVRSLGLFSVSGLKGEIPNDGYGIRRAAIDMQLPRHLLTLHQDSYPLCLSTNALYLDSLIATAASLIDSVS
jgi:hypothetical protein